MLISELIDDLRTAKLAHGNLEVQVARDIGVKGVSCVNGKLQIEADLGPISDLIRGDPDFD